MSRVRTLFTTVLPSAIAGGLLFASAFGHAETGRDGSLGFWPAASDSATGSVILAQADPRPRPRAPIPPPPAAPPVVAPPAVPPVPPVPPVPSSHSRRSGGHGVSVSIHDGRIEIDGIEELVERQLEAVATTLDSLPDVPPDVRERVKGRIRAVREKINGRISRLKALDLDKLDRLGPEMERMGDEIEKAMEGLDKDLAQLGDKLGKNFAKKFGKDFAKSLGPSTPTPPSVHSSGHDNDDADDDDDDDDDDKEAVVVSPGPDIDPGDPADMAPAIAALKGIDLDPHQKELIAKLRADSDSQIQNAKRELEEMSNHLHDTLLDNAASEADIARQIDSISAKEATIRKARILTWVKARNVLRKDQRKLIETAAHRGH